MRFAYVSAVVFVLFTPLPAAAELSDHVDPRVIAAFAETAAECAAMGGTLRLPANPVTLVDLTGDGTLDIVVSEAGAFCGPDLPSSTVNRVSN